MGYGFLLVTFLVFGGSLYYVLKAKRDSFKVEAVCVDVKKIYNMTKGYEGIYQYQINGREYTVCYEKGSILKPKKGVATYVYVNRSDFEKIVPREEVLGYYWFIGVAVLASVYVLLEETMF